MYLRITQLVLLTLFTLSSSVFANPSTQYHPVINPITDQDFIDNGTPSDAKVKLGQMLFFDKILSGNQNISCATCHHPMAGSGDGWSLPIGEGGAGLGVTRNTGEATDAIHERVPRNAPPIFNLGALEQQVMFHDGRVSVDVNHPSGFQSPAGDDLPLGLENILAVQAMFPVTSGTEMAGQINENPQANLSAAGNLTDLWDFIADKLKAIDEYALLFNEAFGIDREEITMVHAANAIAAFENAQFKAINSPFDQYLQNTNDLTSTQKKGMYVFYKKAGCGRCHNGALLTDHQFHAIAMPQIGNGKGDGFEGREDFGRMRVTGNPSDKFKFRTPSLRNITLTAPYGHDGAYDTLEDVIKHHLAPVDSLLAYDISKARLASRADLDAIDQIIMNNPVAVQSIAAANELTNTDITDEELANLISFLESFTDPNFVDMRRLVPARVPSGLPVFD